MRCESYRFPLDICEWVDFMSPFSQEARTNCLKGFFEGHKSPFFVYSGRSPVEQMSLRLEKLVTPEIMQANLTLHFERINPRGEMQPKGKVQT
jgi:hypothetical protein